MNTLLADLEATLPDQGTHHEPFGHRLHRDSARISPHPHRLPHDRSLMTLATST
jgi:hypothetical protein